MLIRRMTSRRPRSNALVSHTLRHFVREGSGFDQCIEAGTLDGAGARELLMAAGVSRTVVAGLPIGDPALQHQSGYRDWWAVGWREVVVSIHDRGYAPRYEAILTAHLPLTTTSSVWSRSRRRWTLTDPASPARIVADVVQEGTALMVVTAFRAEMTRAPSRVVRSPEDEALAELLRGFRR